MSHPTPHSHSASFPPPVFGPVAPHQLHWRSLGRKETHTCGFGAGSLRYISSHRKTRQQEVPLSSLRQPSGAGGAPARACGPQDWPCTTLETTETEACRAGSEEVTLDATWCLKTHSLCLWFGVLKDHNRARGGQSKSQGLVVGHGMVHGSPEPLFPGEMR